MGTHTSDATAINTVDVAWHDPNVHPWAPFVVANPLTDRLVALIDRAERRLAITSFYFKPARALAHAVLRAARRGVHVEIFHSGASALVESDVPWLCAAIDYPALLAAGVVIRESARGGGLKSRC